jgi:hypothetical protein
MSNLLKGLQVVVVAALLGMMVAVCGWICQAEDRFKIQDNRLEMNRSQIDRLNVLFDQLEARNPPKRADKLILPPPRDGSE